MIKQTILYLLAVFQIYLLSAQHHTIPFYDGTFADLQIEAEQTQKPYFVFFTTAECDPCSKMTTYTFTDESLVEYTDANYLAYRVSVDSYRGEDLNLAQKHGIMFYPTVILFDSEGKDVAKFTGFKVASDFLSTLEEYHQTQKENVIYESIDSLESQGTVTNISAPVIIDEIEPTSSQEDEIPVENLSANLKTAPIVTNKAKNKSNLFKISISQQSTEGYGVQIGVYREYTNVIKEVQRLESGGYTGVLVNFGSLLGAPVFKVVLGPFNSEKDAETFKGHMDKKEGRKGMVVKLSKYGK